MIRLNKGNKTPTKGIFLTEKEYKSLVKDRELLDEIQKEIQTWNIHRIS